MKTFSLTLVALGMAAVIGVMASARSLDDSSKSWQRRVDNMGRQDFDFLVGEWRVHHRRLKFDTHEWLEFDGTCSNRKSMNGSANIEEHMLNAPGGTYSAIALRSYDSKTQQWAIWWLDSRYPLGPLDPPVKGQFTAGVGIFFSEDTYQGKPIRVRFIWSQITNISARWEQAFSYDAGKTWETNWIMNFQRKS